MSTFYGVGEEKWIKHYSSSQNILLVGEGDFSFSVCLARAFGSAHNIVSTSLDSYVALLLNYKDAISNVNELKERGCNVLHDVDATKMAEESSLSCIQKFDRIVYNFPYADHISGDTRSNQISNRRTHQSNLVLVDRRHRKLVIGFLSNAKELLKVDGEVHITHKTNGFHSEWLLPVLASMLKFKLIEEVDFNLGDYPGYSNKYGNGGTKGDLSFDCNPSKTYKFVSLV